MDNTTTITAAAAITTNNTNNKIPKSIIVNDENFPSLPSVRPQATEPTPSSSPSSSTTTSTSTPTATSTPSQQKQQKQQKAIVKKSAKSKREQHNAIDEKLQHLYRELKSTTTTSTTVATPNVQQQKQSSSDDNTTNSDNNHDENKETKENRYEKLSQESRTLKTDLQHLKQQLKRIEAEKQEFSHNREQLKKQMEDEWNNASLKTELKAQRCTQLTDMKKSYKKIKKRNEERRMNLKYQSVSEVQVDQSRLEQELVRLQCEKEQQVEKQRKLQQQQQQQQQQKQKQEQQSGGNNKGKNKKNKKGGGSNNTESDNAEEVKQQVEDTATTSVASVASVVSLDAQIEEVERQLSECRKERGNCQSYLHAFEKQLDMKQSIKSLKQEISDLELEIKTSLDNHKKLVRAVDEAYLTVYISDQLPGINREIHEKQKRYRVVMDELKKLGEVQREQQMALEKRKAEIKEMIRQQKLNKQMLLSEKAEQSSSNGTSAVTHSVFCKPNQQRLLLENKGKLIKKMAEESGAEISLVRSTNSIVIRGTETSANAALQAVQEWIDQCSDREESFIRFKPEMASILIQKQTIAELKKKTGAKSLFVDKLDGVIRIETGKSNMNHAKNVIQQYLAENVPLNLSVPVDAETAMLLLNAVKRIADASKVSRVFVDLNANAVQLSGRSATVHKAKQFVEELVAQIKENKEVMKVSKGELQQVMGKARANLKMIEEKSGAFLSVDTGKSTVVLRGTSDSIVKAKQEISSLIQPKKKVAENKKDETPNGDDGAASPPSE